MTTRLEAELALMREQWPTLTYEPTGQWVLLPEQHLPAGWSQRTVAVAFQVPTGPAGSPPYAFFVNEPLTFQGQQPTNYAAASGIVPFAGNWAQFSWAPETWQWAEDPAQGANMRSFARSFAERFAEGA